MQGHAASLSDIQQFFNSHVAPPRKNVIAELHGETARPAQMHTPPLCVSSAETATLKKKPCGTRARSGSHPQGPFRSTGSRGKDCGLQGTKAEAGRWRRADSQLFVQVPSSPTCFAGVTLSRNSLGDWRRHTLAQIWYLRLCPQQKSPDILWCT